MYTKYLITILAVISVNLWPNLLASLLVSSSVNAAETHQIAQSQHQYAQQPISLAKVIELAQQNDPWLHGSKLKQSAFNAKSLAASSLPDPKVSLGFINVPTDSWDLDQEGMTQFKVGVSQMLPRGDSLEIKASQLEIESSKHPLLREDRKAKIQMTVSQLWLDAYRAQTTISLINNNRHLFEQLVATAQANYSSAIAKTRQQDVIRPQLELVKLDYRLMMEHQKLDMVIAELNEWLPNYHNELNFNVTQEPINIELTRANFINHGSPTRNELAQAVARHPLLLVIDKSQDIANKGISLAKQEYKPQWSVNASYAVREDDPLGNDRADFFSVSVTFDVPLFTGNKQDKSVSASISQSEAIKTEKLLLTKSIISQLEKEIRQLKRLSQRQTLYVEQLLSQTNAQAEASLSAYTHDDGDFLTVLNDRVAVLNTQISALNIDIDVIKTIARINYFLTQSASITTHPIKFGEQ